MLVRRNSWGIETRDLARQHLRLVDQIWQTLRANINFLFLKFQGNERSFLFRNVAIQTNSLGHSMLQNRG
jgi:hypothetical protein